VAQALKEQGCNVGYLSSQDQEPPAFDERWSAVLLDDVHLYTAVQQHAAFAWFVQAQSQQAGVVAAGELPPADLKLREDLRTRLGWGHVWALHAMGDDERRAVLISAAAERGLSLSPEVVDFILTRFSRDLGHLMQLLHHLDAYALQVQRTITIPLIKDMLQDS
jgi:DnaA family protein